MAGFAALLAVAAGVLFGFAPALTATESSLVASIQHDRLRRGFRPRRLRDALIVGEVTSSLVLLIAAGLFLRLGDRVARFDHGYDVQRVIDVRLQGDKSALIRRLASDSRFEAVTEVYRSPLSGSLPQLPGLVDGRALSLGYNYVDPRFFETLGIAVLRGRTFTPAETRSQAPVAVVSDATARRLWPGSDPLGRRFEVKPGDKPARFAPGEYEVIGVVRDVINGRLDEGPDFTLVYFPAAERDTRNAGLLARVNRDPQAVLPDLKEACFELGPAGSCSPMPLTDVAWLQRFPYVITRDLSCGVAAVALGLVAIGLYGVVAFAAAQRKREVGIRMALGARAGAILWALMAESWRRVALGIAIGLPLCLAVAYAGSMHAHGAGLPLFDLAAYAATTAFLIAVVSLATWLPARRASRIDPAIVLREE